MCLTGVPVGFRGPWGTTYASNLRLYVQQFTADTWVQVMHAREVRPPDARLLGPLAAVGAALADFVASTPCDQVGVRDSLQR